MLLFIIFITIGLILWACCKVGSKTETAEIDINLRHISTYFFTKGVFDFEKFSDYILCIKENDSVSDMANYLMELDLLMKCSPELEKRVTNILIYSQAIIELNCKEFVNIQQSLRDKKFKGTYQDLVYIYFTTIFYIKHQMAIKK